MNRFGIIAIVIALLAVGFAAILRHDLQNERERANELAERVAVLEPVERADSSKTRQLRPQTITAPIEPIEIERPPNVSTTRESVPPPTPVRGSAHARRQVEQLQGALRDATPLQPYQINALADAIDRVRSEARGDGTAGLATEHDRLVQAAAEVLFESQLERYIELLESESKDARE